MCTVLVGPLMSFAVLLCFLVTSLIAFCGTHSTSEIRYECGPHGKFEYCIDGIPGCVIGCHCHPGYYFDTDTKICEPNMKLTQDFRRNYAPEPTRVYEPPPIMPTATEATISTPSATNNNADKIDEIPKDTDELGDWLYNQFFKTIESQVINNSNNTKPDSKEKPPTRRSGGESAPVINKSRRKTRKSMRGGRKKKHMKVHGLRRKLLRITEDDSLFDSESGSDSSGSSSGSESDSESDDSGESSEGNGKKPTNPDDKDHGHKKVIIFNRRPKPPLPSFIFLPSMDTPYYPPIGLPPPPVMPMYPMVPVPPMAPPMFPPYPGPPPCDEEGSNATTTSSAAPPASSTDAATSDAPTTTEEPPTTPEGTLRKGDRRSRFEKHHRRPIPEQFIARASEPGIPNKLKHGPRNKLMQKLREKMKVNERNQINTSDAELDDLANVGSVNEEDVPDLPEAFSLPKRISQRKPEEPKIPKLDDVDFTYLSELIHRVNESQAKHRLASLPFDLNKGLKDLQQIKAQQTRRTYDSYNLPPVNVQPEINQQRNLHKQGSDDVYYTNLGRQIAAMIRNADSQVNFQSNKDSESVNRQLPFHSVLNENSHMPRSYWERSVRSPLNQLGPFSNYLDESRTLKHSNERSLLNLENEVEIFASTPEPLSLQDLENILNTMQKAHAHQMRQPVTSTKQSNMSLNVNLLPKYIRPENSYRRLFDEPGNLEYFTEHYQATSTPPKVYVKTHAPDITNLTIFHGPESNYNSPFNDYWVTSNNQHPIPPKPIPMLAVVKSKPLSRDIQIYKTNVIRPPSVGVVLPKRPAEAKKPHGEYLAFLRSMPIVKQTTPKRYEPKLGNNDKLNFFSGNKHHYMFEASSYPLLTPFKRQIKKKYGNPSYFHPQLHHFEYFD